MKEKKKHLAGKKYQPAEENLKKNKNFDLIGLAIVILLGLIIYLNSFNCSFHFDDRTSIVENTKIQNLSYIKGIWDYSHTRFIPYLTFAVNYHFDGLNVWGYHLFNLIIHLINSCLVWMLTLLIFSSPNLKNYQIVKHKRTIPFLTALLFVSHPLATQSVTYIVQRMASMAAMFYLLSLVLYVKARLSKENNASKYFLFIGSFVSAVLAMLTKENAFTLPFTIVLFEIFFLSTKNLEINFKDSWVILFTMGLLGFISIVLIKYSSGIFKTLTPDIFNDYRTVTPLNYLFTQFSVIVKYLQLLVLPINQNFDYDIPIINNFFELKTLLGFLFISAMLTLAIFLFKRQRIISFGIFWFFLTLAVESSIIPISDLINEHRTYLPSFGFFLILSSGVFYFLRNKNKYIPISILLIIIISNSILAYKRNNVWKNDLTLYSDVISKSPDKARAYNGRAIYFQRKDMYEEALNDYNKSIELRPNNAESYYNRGNIFVIEKKNNLAIDDYSKVLELDAKYTKAYYNRGKLLQDEDRNDEALKDYNKAVELDPDFLEAYFNRGNLFAQEKKNDLAIADYKKAIDLNPDYIEAYLNRGNIFRDENKIEEALSDYKKAIELNPDFAIAYFNRGTLFMNLKKYDESISDFSKAIALKNDYAKAYYNRGISEYYNRKTDDACADIKHAAGLGYQPAKDAIIQVCK